MMSMKNTSEMMRWQSEVQNLPFSETIQPSLWNTWTRDASTGLNENLPFQEAKEVPIELNGKSELFLYRSSIWPASCIW